MRVLKRLNARTGAEILFRAGEYARILGERAGLAPHPRFPVEAGTGASSLLPVVLIESFRDAGSVRELWRHLFPRAVERSISTGDHILQNEIPIFSDMFECGREIDWHLDYRTGVRAPRSFGRGIDALDRAVAGDAKNIWELNRCGFFVSLGQAFWATGDRRYFDAWKALVNSWIDANPCDYGINWSSSLELAIRAVNWLWSSWFFRQELESDPAFLVRFGESLLLHADRISRHLSYYFSPNTHLTGEALGLLYIGKAYPNGARARRNAALGEKILRSELGKQILSDGGYFERATWYHKYTIDFYLHLLLLAGAPDARMDEAAAALKRMTTHLALMSEPDGTIPLIGDADGGQLLFLDGCKGNVRAACCSAASILGDGELKELAGGEFAEEALWLLGARGLERFERIEQSSRRSYHSLNEETGWYCLRTGMGARDPFIIFDCGPHGWGACGHAHADLLSILWYAGGSMVLVDPGNPVYGSDPSLRNRMRSSACHNTITIGGESQSIPGELFKWRRIARPVSKSCAVEGDYAFVEGQHQGYDASGCRHWRGVLFLGGDIVVIADIVRCVRSIPSILYNLQFGEGVLADAGNGLFRFVAAAGGVYGVRILGVPEPVPAIVPGLFSRDYNHVVQAPRLAWERGPIAGDILILTLLAADIGGLADFRFDGSGGVKGMAGGRRCAFKVEAAPRERESLRIVPRVSATVEGAGGLHVLRLNGGGFEGWRLEPAMHEEPQ